MLGRGSNLSPSAPEMPQVPLHHSRNSETPQLLISPWKGFDFISNVLAFPAAAGRLSFLLACIWKLMVQEINSLSGSRTEFSKVSLAAPAPSSWNRESTFGSWWAPYTRNLSSKTSPYFFQKLGKEYWRELSRKDTQKWRPE